MIFEIQLINNHLNRTGVIQGKYPRFQLMHGVGYSYAKQKNEPSTKEFLVFQQILLSFSS